MNDRVAIPLSKIRKARPTPKGRAVDAVALKEIDSLLGAAPRAPEYLVENLHKVQDRFGCLAAAHLAALAELMKLSQAEVFEVATFYHHFDVVKEGEAAPAKLTVRVCETLSCRIGRRARASRAPGGDAGPERASARSAVHRSLCRSARGVRGPERLWPRHRREGRHRAGARGCEGAAQHAHRLRGIPPARRLRPLGRLRRGQARPRDGPQDAGRFGAPGTRGRGLPGGAQVADRARRGRAPLHGRQRRRGRAGHVQGPSLPRARPAPLPRGNARGGVGGGHREDLDLPSRRVSRLPRGARARNRRTRGGPAGAAAGDQPAPRRGRLHLRRGVRDDRVDRGQARHATASAALRRAGGRLRAADARAQLRDAALGSRDPREGRGTGSPPRAATAARDFARSRFPGA